MPITISPQIKLSNPTMLVLQSNILITCENNLNKQEIIDLAQEYCNT